MAAQSPPPGASYDGFISYSHAIDGKLAPALQHALHTLAKPWYKLRALHIFRDETSLSANPDLWLSIEKALASSRWFIYFASPRASESVWVRREIDWWLTNRGPSTLLIALTEGTLQANDLGTSFDWQVTDAFPREFADRLQEEPLWVDLSWAHHSDHLSLRHTQFRTAALRLAAPIHGRPMDELDGEDVRQNRRTRRVARAATGALLVLTGLAVTAAYLAVRRSRESVSRELSVYALQQLDSDPELSVRLALDAAASAPTEQAEDALRRALMESKVLETIGTPARAEAAKYSASGRWRLMVSGKEVALLNAHGDMPILRHPSLVSVAAFGPDETIVATGGWDGKIRLWSVTSGQMIAECQSADATLEPSKVSIVNRIVFSPDGRLLATTDRDGLGSDAKAVTIWDVKTAKQTASLTVDADRVADVAFAPDSTRLATAGLHGTVRIWDAATGHLLRTLADHTDTVTAVAFTPDGTQVVSTSLDGVRVWNASSGAVFAKSASPDPGRDVMGFDHIAAISPSTRHALLRNGATTTIYDPHAGRALGTIADFPGTCSKAVFSPDDRLVACPGQDGKAVVWDVDLRQRVAVFNGHHGELNDLSFSPDGRALLTAGTDATVRTWDLDEMTRTLVLPVFEQGVDAAAWSPDGQLVASGSGNGVRVWDARTGRTLAVLPTPINEITSGQVIGVSFATDSRQLLVSSLGVGGDVHVWDARAGTRRLTLDTHDMAPTLHGIASWTADGLIFVSASQDEALLRVRHELPPLDLSKPTPPPAVGHELLRWDGASGLPLAPIPAGRGQEVEDRSCGYSRAAGIACTKTDRDTVARVWNVRTGAMITEITSHLPMVMLSSMSPDGRFIAMGDLQQVEIWDARTGRLQSRVAKRSLLAHLDFDAEGTRLVTSGDHLDPVARAWEVSTGRLLAEFRGHTHRINRAHFSPDGRLIVTASEDNTAGIWNSHSGRRLMTLGGNQNKLSDAIFSPDGRRVLTSGRDGAARIYDVSLARPLAELLAIAQQRRPRALTPQEAAQFPH